MKSTKSRIIKWLVIFLLCVINISCFFINPIFRILNVTYLNGVLMAIHFSTCLIMLQLDYKYGSKIAFTLMVAYLIQIIFTFGKVRGNSAIPGFFNTILYIITLYILARKFIILEKFAVTDSLTGLKNRRGLFNEMDSLIFKKKPFYTVYIELGNFKQINDTYGHYYGDQVLKLVTQRIIDVLGTDGIATRINGAEFVVIIFDDEKVHDLTRKILDAIREKNSIIHNGIEITGYLTAYAGISHYPFDAKDSDTLIKFADIAMYAARKNNANQITDFTKDMEDTFLHSIEVEKNIKEGFSNNNFYMVYQPQYNMEGKRLRGFEALLRLKNNGGETISPAEFIPIAEASDLIFQIDDFVLNIVMQEFSPLLKKSKDIVISVNVSAKNIASFDFAERIERMLKKNDFNPHNLEIEITEYCLVNSVETTVQNINRLKDLGVQIALDDFGTGYTSLSYIAKLPVNLLKIDKTLVDDITSSQKSQDFVNAVISMGHIMGCDVISEGVENQPQLDILKTQGCDFVQGFVWSKPLDYDVAKDMIQRVS